MAEGDSIEWEPEEILDQEEPADLGVLDYDYSSVQEKIQAGLKEKEKGNKLFAKGKYEQAWKQYDRCFVHIYTSKEEWEAIGAQARADINNFKLPCHLNRGLCRMREDDLDNALWDFSEALRIDPNNTKGLYRRAVVYIRLLRKDLSKQDTGELWDLDNAEKRAEDARTDLLKAVKFAPNDSGIRKAYTDLKNVKEELAEHRKLYRRDQRKMYSKLMNRLDRENQNLTETEDAEIYAAMPRLQRIKFD